MLYEGPSMKAIKYCASTTAFCLLIIMAGSRFAAGQTPNPSPPPNPTPPSSDIYVSDLKIHNGQIKFSQPIKITNTPGYNNQPSFLTVGPSILYASIRDKQTDIFGYDLHSSKTIQITNTPESEYSPTLMPDGKNISVVRVEADGTQRLWKFPLAGGAPSLILEKTKPVGYHLWIDDHTLALFILGGGKPNTLQIVPVATEKPEVIAENPARIPRRSP